VRHMQDRYNETQKGQPLVLAILDTFIPRTPTGREPNGPCTMMVEAGELARRPSW
jgi:hypothetical protein